MMKNLIKKACLEIWVEFGFNKETAHTVLQLHNLFSLHLTAHSTIKYFLKGSWWLNISILGSRLAVKLRQNTSINIAVIYYFIFSRNNRDAQ